MPTVSIISYNHYRCIECIPKLVGPLLDLIFEATGWKGFFMGGGPEPAAGGRIKVMGYVLQS